MFSIFRHIRCQYSSLTKLFPDPALHKSLCASQLKNTDVVPNRGMRGMRSSILHKEVVDKYRLKKQKEEAWSAPMIQVVKDDDMPVSDLANPYEKPPKKCLLCEHDVPLDYKNTRLLSQFVSPHTGRIYGRQITGLCLFMQRRVARLVKRSRYFGLMPYEMKDPRYLRDPKLFDPFRRK